MVRFQAIRSFASAGESSKIDYLVTKRSDTGIDLIAAAISPQDLAQVEKLCKVAVILSPNALRFVPFPQLLCT